MTIAACAICGEAPSREADFLLLADKVTIRCRPCGGAGVSVVVGLISRSVTGLSAEDQCIALWNSRQEGLKKAMALLSGAFELHGQNITDAGHGGYAVASVHSDRRLVPDGRDGLDGLPLVVLAALDLLYATRAAADRRRQEGGPS